MQDQFEWPESEHEADKVILRNVRNHGCHIAGIPGANPPFAFSIGLFLSYGHPELIIFGQNSENAQAIINLIRDRVASGHEFVDGDISDDLLENGYKLGFWQVPFGAYPEYLGTEILVLLEIAACVPLSADHLAGRQSAVPLGSGTLARCQRGSAVVEEE